jgi:hypothetical protein
VEFQLKLAESVHPLAPIHFTPFTSDGDGLFSPPTLELSESVRSGHVAYTPVYWGQRKIGFSNDGGLRGPQTVVEFVAKVQLGASGTSPEHTRCPDLGGVDMLTRGPWLRELGRPVGQDPVAPDSDELIKSFGEAKVRIAWWTTTAKQGNSIYGMPINVAPGNQPMIRLILGNYAKESDPGLAPFFKGMTIQSWYDPSGIPPAGNQVNTDHHGIVLLRNEKTGGIDRLYEAYQVESEDHGRNWTAASLSIFDLVTGATRPDGWTTGTAAGVPIAPFLVRYDEAARGAIRHPIRLVIPTGTSRNRYIWPARHTAFTGSNDSGLPMGARLRLKEEWFQTHRPEFSRINRAILDAMRRYGLIVTDLASGGFWIDGVNDERWDRNDVLELQNIPASAFEVVDTIRSKISFSGPSKGIVGVPCPLSVRHLVPADSNFSTNVYLYVSADQGNNWQIVGSPAQLDDNHRGPLIMSWTPPGAGTFLLKAKPFLPWLEPPVLAIKVARPQSRRRVAR